MASERYVDPAVGQALEEVRESLRAERESQGELGSQNAQLRERMQRLEAERDRLRGELEGLKRGPAGPMPRLPEVLQVPFAVRPSVPVRRKVREALPMLLLTVLALSVGRNMDISAWGLFAFALVMVAVQVITNWLGLERWRFEEAGLKAWQLEVPGGLLRYQDMLRVEAHSSSRQRLRGVGSVGVTYKAGLEEKVLLLKNVPEPERLAEWLESKRSGPV